MRILSSKKKLTKIISFVIPCVTLVFFVLVMLSGSYLKKPFNPSEDVVKFINSCMSDVKAEHWDDAEKDLKALEKAWEKITPRIQFSVERDEIYNLSINIARLKGSIGTKDKTSSLMELNETLENWHELTK